jgi:hypothetical protein
MEMGRPNTYVTVPDQSRYSLPEGRAIIYVGGKPVHVRVFE